jgi:intracellular septation protein A
VDISQATDPEVGVAALADVLSVAETAEDAGTAEATGTTKAAQTADAGADDHSRLSRTLLKTVGPRLLRDILGPTLSFYAVWKLTGNVIAGVAVGSAVSLIAYRYERRRGRPGLIARFVLAIVVIQAVVGLATGSATAYLIQPTILGAVNGVVWLGSVAIGRPLAGIFAREIFPVDEETRASTEFRRAFRHVSLLFGIFFLVFAVFQAGVLLILGIGAFVAIRVVDVVCTLGMVVYCLRYISRHLGALFAAS